MQIWTERALEHYKTSPVFDTSRFVVFRSSSMRFRIGRPATWTRLRRVSHPHAARWQGASCGLEYNEIEKSSNAAEIARGGQPVAPANTQQQGSDMESLMEQLNSKA